jgi:hypothetical protein
MVKKDRKEKRLHKIAAEKEKLKTREEMLEELKKLAIDKNTQSRLRSVVTSNQKLNKKSHTSAKNLSKQ